MGSHPRSKFAAQFVTLLQLQTCCCLVQPKKLTEERGSSKKNSKFALVKNRELEQLDQPKRKEQEFELSAREEHQIQTLICGQHVMKRRNVLDGKPRRPVKRPTTSSKIGENFYGR